MASVRAAVMVIALLTVCLLAMNASAPHYGCCRSYLKAKIPFKAIKGYSVQTTERCAIRAIIFHVKKGKVCAKPDLSWPIEYVNKIRKKAQMVHVRPSPIRETEPNSFLKRNDTSSIPDQPSIQQR